MTKASYILNAILLGALLGIVTGCATSDPARIISRNCPVKRVYGEEASRICAKGSDWNGGKVYVVGVCWYDAQAITKWARAQGIECETKTVDAYYGRKIIKNGHVTVNPIHSKYYCDYRDRVGVVRIKK